MLELSVPIILNFQSRLKIYESNLIIAITAAIAIVITIGIDVTFAIAIAIDVMVATTTTVAIVIVTIALAIAATDNCLTVCHDHLLDHGRVLYLNVMQIPIVIYKSKI